MASFDELARRMQSPLVAFLERRFPSRRDAEDVAQEALVRAWQSLASFREGKRFRTWVFTIAYRLAVSRGRARAMGGTTGELPIDAADTADSPLDLMQRREREENIWAVAGAVLSSEQVEALWLTYVEEMPASEVAGVMGRSWVSVKTMLHRARKKLAPHLAAEVGEERSTQRSGGLR